ncbi:MAG TPA: hypothetical protein DCS83_09620 [Prevotella sp.]|nr:hypothetical protein [Prevotella sp.]
MLLNIRYFVVSKRYLIIVTLLFLLISSLRAQYDPEFSHYFDMEPSFNPGSVGKESKLNIETAYALDFAGFKDNPRTMYVGADMPFYALKNYHGIGVNIINDEIGLFTHKRFAIQYAYKHKLFKGILSVGIQGNLISEGFDGSKVDLENTGDPAFATSNVTGSGMDVALGIYYIHRFWYIGLSGQHLTSPTITLGTTNRLKIDANYYLTGGYNIKLRNPFVTIQPSVLIRTDGSDYRADITGRLVYTHENKIFYGGVTYSPTNSVTFLLGGNFHGIMIGYSYEMYTSTINIGNGSHELYVGYQTDINLVKKGRNVHKSVRIL